MYGCSPDWTANWIHEDDLTSILTQLAGKIKPSPRGPHKVSLNYGLHFTGGEPFLNFELLLKAVEIAEKLQIPSTFVETNCYWCTSDTVTREKLRLLKGKGLKGILISVNPFFLEFVPFERTERAVRISQEVFGDNVMIYQLTYYRIFKEMGVKGKILVEDFLRSESGKDLTWRVEIFLTGRGAYRLRKFYPSYPADYFFDQPCQPPLLRNWHNHFDNFGNYLPGYCGGISLGDCRNLNHLLKEGIDPEQNPILKTLILQDVKGLFYLARDFGYRQSPDGYISKCHLCLDLRKYLASRKRFKELQPEEFYLHVE